MPDLTVGFGCLQSPLAKAPFEAGRLELLVEEVDLAAERLALLIHGSVPIDFGHETPVMNGKLIELTTECGEHGSAPAQGSDEPCR